ncbi:hypothetical protein FH608_045930 [Nonomuraea phyllanthi]|uniref:Uncharacterized protein n=1 Tax=Nonomuraea phyllanthi TaxID=2219224 RepID=A0A5C4V670_9ACTN|nr:hypothetical protein [Nonomuraea phyllanthi]KAB8186837.1 hypothetical protein FH608_045930 [Nonomuraea phyllanthi]
MNAYRESQMSVGKAAALVLALVAGAGLSGAFGDGKTSHDVSDTKPLFGIGQEKPKHSKPAKRQDGPPPMTCQGDQCWWTDMGRPGRR